MNKTIVGLLLLLILNSCGGGLKLPGGDARENPPDPRERVKKNLEEGKGFRINDAFKKKNLVQIMSLLARMNYGEHLWI